MDANDDTNKFKDMEDSEIDKLTGSNTEDFQTLIRRQQDMINSLLEAKISGDESEDEIRIKARKFAVLKLTGALNTIGDLSENAEKESTRLAAARTIWAIASATSPHDENDPIEKLFKKLENGNTQES